MANRRNLKKNVNYISTVLTGLCAMESVSAAADKKEAYAAVFVEILRVREDIVSRISHTEPGNVKGFYKKLHADFNAKVEEISAKLDELAK